MISLGDNLVEAKFESRYKRFLADVTVGRRHSLAFVPNTGRLERILTRGSIVLLRKAPRRRAPYDMLVAYEGETPVVVDSRVSNLVVEEALRQDRLPRFSSYHDVQREVRIGGSRLDFVLRDSRPYYLEVKGCTMARNSVALYPDAPTERGRKHLELLARLHSEGKGAGILFLAMRTDVRRFQVNNKMDRAFGNVLGISRSKGVEVYAYSISLSDDFRCGIGRPLRIGS